MLALNKFSSLKTETGSHLISSGVLAGLKLYHVQKHNDDIKRVYKGVAFTVCKGTFLHECLQKMCSNKFNCKKESPGDSLFKISNYTFRVEKYAVSAILDKAYLLVDGVMALPHSHHFTSDRDIWVEYKQRLCLEKAQ